MLRRGLLLVVGGVLITGIAVIVFLAQRPPTDEYPPYVVAKAAEVSGTPRPIQVILRRGADRLLQRDATGFPCRSASGQMGCPPSSIEIRPITVFLVRDEAGALHAFIGEDPRNGCALEWQSGTRFYDICHGSIYDRRGQRVGGPSPWNLNQLALEVRDSDVYIDPGRIVVGDCPGCLGLTGAQGDGTGKIQWTPWAPIGVVVLMTLATALLVFRRTGSVAFGVSTAVLVLALASLALGTIATVAFIWGGALLVAALVGYGIGVATRRGWPESNGRRPP